MFDEDLKLMVRHSQQSPAGTVVTWSEGESVRAKVQLSNMRDTLVAQAQGVKPTGYLVVKVDDAGNPIYPIVLDSYLRFPRGGVYVRVADHGVIEAGAGIYKERQFAVEAVEVLPR